MILVEQIKMKDENWKFILLSSNPLNKRVRYLDLDRVVRKPVNVNPGLNVN